MITSFRAIKIPFSSIEDLRAKILALRPKKIISVKNCVPDSTDVRHWVSVYYEYHR